MFLRYEYANCRGSLLKFIKFQFTYDLVHKAWFLAAERQLSILGPDWCILNDLSHRLCIVKRPKRGRKLTVVYLTSLLESLLCKWLPLSDVAFFFLAYLTSLRIRCIWRQHVVIGRYFFLLLMIFSGPISSILTASLICLNVGLSPWNV